MSLFFNISPAFFAQAVLVSYLVSYSLRFDKADLDYLTQSNQVAATDSDKWTLSVWIKSASDSASTFRTIISGGENNAPLYLGLDDKLHFYEYNGTSVQMQFNTDETIKVADGWTHVVMSVDYASTSSTFGDKVKVWIDGTPATLSTDPDGTDPGAGAWSLQGGSASAMNGNTYTQWSTYPYRYIGRKTNSLGRYFDGEMAEFHFIDGQFLDATYFGEYNSDNVWVPKEVTGIDYGYNGFYLDFKGNDTGVTLLLDGSAASLTTDASSAGNDPTNSNVTSTTATITGRSAASDVFSFDGTDDYLTLPSNFNGELGEDDFTVECWLKTDTTTGTHAIFDCRQASGQDPGWVLYLDGTSLIHLENSGFNLTATSAITSTTDWYHVALVRSSDTVTMFVDGSSVGTVNVANTSFDFANPLTIGQVSYGGSSVGDFDGLMADIRITKGYARYSDSFTPPTSALSADVSGITGSDDVTLLLDGSDPVTNLKSGGATIENPNSDVSTTTTDPGSHPYATNFLEFTSDERQKLVVDNDTNVAFGTDDWTFETWIYQDNSSTNETLFDMRATGTSVGGGLLFINSSNKLEFAYKVSTESSSKIVGTDTLTANYWHHVALTVNNNVVTIWLDGINQGTWDSTTNSFTPLANPGIGFESYTSSGNIEFDGYMTDIRITKGAALYPQHPPISALANTPEYLGDFGVDRTTNNNDFTLVGNFTPDDQLLDTPNLRFATLDPDDIRDMSTLPGTGDSLGNGSLSEGNYQFNDGSDVRYQGTTFSTLGKSSGKWYVEFHGNGRPGFGLYDGVRNSNDLNHQNYNNQVNQRTAINGPGRIWTPHSSSLFRWDYPATVNANTDYNTNINSSYGTTWVSGDIVGMAFDLGNGTIEYFINGTSQGQAFSDLNSSYSSGNDWYVAVSDVSNTTDTYTYVNFGQDHTFAGQKPTLLTPYSDANGNGEFYYQPPSGFLALATEYK